MCCVHVFDLDGEHCLAHVAPRTGSVWQASSSVDFVATCGLQQGSQGLIPLFFAHEINYFYRAGDEAGAAISQLPKGGDREAPSGHGVQA